MPPRGNQSRRKQKQNVEKSMTLLREGSGILLLCLTAFIAVSLFSFDPSDPSFNYTGDDEQVSNLAGLAGAHLADLTLQLFGYSSGWLLLLIGFLGFQLFRNRPISLYLDRILALPMLAVVTSLLAAMFFTPDSTPLLPAGPGGMLGLLAAKAIRRTFGFWGGLILLVPLAVLSMMVLTRFSLQDFINRVQHEMGFVGGWTGDKIRASAAARAEQKAAQAEAALAEAEAQAEAQAAEDAAFAEEDSPDLPQSALEPDEELDSGHQLDEKNEERYDTDNNPPYPEHLSRLDSDTPSGSAGDDLHPEPYADMASPPPKERKWLDNILHPFARRDADEKSTVPQQRQEPMVEELPPLGSLGKKRMEPRLEPSLDGPETESWDETGPVRDFTPERPQPTPKEVIPGITPWAEEDSFDPDPLEPEMDPDTPFGTEDADLSERVDAWHKTHAHKLSQASIETTPQGEAEETSESDDPESVVSGLKAPVVATSPLSSPAAKQAPPVAPEKMAQEPSPATPLSESEKSTASPAFKRYDAAFEPGEKMAEEADSVYPTLQDSPTNPPQQSEEAPSPGRSFQTKPDSQSSLNHNFDPPEDNRHHSLVDEKIAAEEKPVPPFEAQDRPPSFAEMASGTDVAEPSDFSTAQWNSPAELEVDDPELESAPDDFSETDQAPLEYSDSNPSPDQNQVFAPNWVELETDSEETSSTATAREEPLEATFDEPPADEPTPAPALPVMATLDDDEEKSPLPPLSMLEGATALNSPGPDPASLNAKARILEHKLGDFKIKGQIIDVLPGPVVTTFELDPAPGLRAAKVIGLADDLARNLAATSVRVVGNIPGKNVIGIEIPNDTRDTVYLKDVLLSQSFQKTNSPLAVALGSDITGNPVVGNLAKMPHLLVAGTTGSGKSVAVNAMICSILFSATPEEVRFLMVDPKMLELSIYEGIPHLLAPVVTDVRKAANLLKWAVQEMEERYRLMSELGVRGLAGYNERIKECIENGEQPTRRVKVGFDPETGHPVEEEEPIPLEHKPLIVIVIDELADLMIQVGKEVEPAIARLAQMARAAGLHLIIATQRPSVDVITGLIKANFPTRIAFKVSSKIDSRTILDAMGAERLLGMGDGLYLPPGTTQLRRIHAPFMTDKSVHTLVRFLKSTGSPQYDSSVLVAKESDDSGGDGGMAAGGGGGSGEEYDELYDQAVVLVIKQKKVSTSMVQRHFKIGYNRAARIVDRMAEDGLISEANSAGKREVLAPNANA
ncbi:MAG: DNA translocase FtsK 4TM domain-containing protein [Magnetococcales bacterium]|nr:DNA translocase FtsK 4TM domain-containing protein [Magnetococcales bacterium]